MKLYKPQLEDTTRRPGIFSSKWLPASLVMGELQRQLWPSQNPSNTWYSRDGVDWRDIQEDPGSPYTCRFLGIQLSVGMHRRRVMLTKAGEIDLDKLLAVHNEMAALAKQRAEDAAQSEVVHRQRRADLVALRLELGAVDEWSQLPGGIDLTERSGTYRIEVSGLTADQVRAIVHVIQQAKAAQTIELHPDCGAECDCWRRGLEGRRVKHQDVTPQ